MKNTLISAIFLMALTACAQTGAKKNLDLPAPENIEMETLLTDRGIIWGMDFLPDGSLIFTEKSGKIGILKNGAVTELDGVPKVNNEVQGGLLGIKVHPNFKENGWIYTTYSELEGENNKVNLIRFKINDNQVSHIENLLSTSATNKWKGHNGSRIVFDNDGYLFWSVGEGGLLSRGGKDSPNLNAQNTSEYWGKIHRLTDDGKVPADNPVLPGQNEPSSIYSYGHRNPQGLAHIAATNEIWETEHGPRGGDELNLIKKGENYGWPLVSYGINYDGVDISGKNHDGYTEPIFQWTPSIGASGLAYLTSDVYGNWQNSFFAGGLALQRLTRIYFEDNVAKEDVVLDKIGRVRDVIQGPDGYLYLSIENPGRIVKLIPQL